VLAKIESAESVGNLNAILDAVDGAMVARGDLGAELPVEEARLARVTVRVGVWVQVRAKLCTTLAPRPLGRRMTAG